MKDIPDLREHFNDNSYRLTGQRQEVLGVLVENSKKHLNAEEIYVLLKQKNSGIGIATVYRTLPLLEKLKLVKRSHFDDGYVRYQIANAKEKHDHHHLICEVCGAVLDIQEDLLDEMEKQVMVKNGFRVTNHSVKLFGICAECLDRKSS